MTYIQKTEPYIFEILDKYDWKNKFVADVGCGQGTTLNYLVQFGASMVGLDMSYQSVSRSRAGAMDIGAANNVQVLQSDAERLPVRSNAFDAVICCGVLHHTADTAGGIEEIRRILKPGGVAIVMLYRSGNPKWWLTKLLRGLSQLADGFSGERGVIANRLRARMEPNQASGTALLELFGVPILKAFSNRQSLEMFAGYQTANITNWQAGFRRMIDILPPLRWVEPALKWIDVHMRETWGFYQVIEAVK
jgi:ubiquinone/menaquinone biosynthesis C-methylase UbiE